VRWREGRSAKTLENFSHRVGFASRQVSHQRTITKIKPTRGLSALQV
jgi:hypothetical protein